MADRNDFYFRQKVTESELDGAFADLEAADRALASDFGFIGIMAGMAVTQQISANLTVQVSGPGVVYDQEGQRIAIASTQNVNCAVDEGALNTAVISPGNSRILSIFAEFDRTLSDPRVDGNSATVFFVREESFQFNVAAGTEAGSPTAPSLRSDQILIADVTLIFGQTTIVNADISTTRRQWAFKTTGTVIAVGTAEEAIQALATALNTDVTGLADHLADATAAHAASAVSYAGSGNWATGSPLTGTPVNVETAIDAVVSDLAATAGATRVGAAAAGNLTAGSVKSQLDELDAEKLALTGGTMSGDLQFNGAEINYSTPVNPSAATNPGINKAEAKNQVKVWANITSQTDVVNDGYGIASVTSNATYVLITFHNNFANTSFACVGSSGSGRAVCFGSKAVGTVRAILINIADGAVLDPSAVSYTFDIVLVGQQ